MNITERAMLAQPTWSVWTARKHDRKVSKEVAKQHNAASDKRAGRYNKCLIDPEHPLYVAIRRIEGEARKFHEKHTLPWSQDGARILPGEMYYDYTAQMGLLKEKFDHAVRDFLAYYPEMKERAKTDLNGMYVESDYPTVKEIAQKFGFRVSFFPVPASNDFRVINIDEKDVASIREQMADEVSGAVREAQRERWERLLVVVKHAVERLSSKDSIFRNSLIDNIKEAVETLPRLALDEDKDFDLVLAEVKAKLSVCDPQDLRDDAKARAKTARDAAEIVKKMSAFMGQV